MSTRFDSEYDPFERKMGKVVWLPPNKFSELSCHRKLPQIIRGTRSGSRVTEVNTVLEILSREELRKG